MVGSRRFDIMLIGHVPSKKNEYTPRRGGKGFFKGAGLRAELDSLSMQVPAWARNLRLEHPHLAFKFTVQNGRSDKDSKETTILDILVSQGVLRNDSIARCNGRKFTPEATISPAEEESTLVRIRIHPNDKKGLAAFEEAIQKVGGGLR